VTELVRPAGRFEVLGSAAMPGRGHKQELHRHSGWWFPAVFLLAVLTLCGLLLGWYLRPGLRSASPTRQSHTLGVSIGGVFFTIPANYFETQDTASERKNVTLMALFPSWRGYADADAGLFADNAPDSPLIRLSLRADSNGLDGHARLERIYRPHLTDPKGTKASFGLTRYSFLGGSGYRDYELFAGETAKDQELLLCERATSQFSSPNCLAVDRPLAPNVSFSYRFKRSYLARWREISTGVEKLLTKFRGA
jgi:hypothetical protein